MSVAIDTLWRMYFSFLSHDLQHRPYGYEYTECIACNIDQEGVKMELYYNIKIQAEFSLKRNAIMLSVIYENYQKYDRTQF